MASFLKIKPKFLFCYYYNPQKQVNTTQVLSKGIGTDISKYENKGWIGEFAFFLYPMQVKIT